MRRYSAADLRSLFDEALDLPPIPRATFLRDVQFSSPLVYQQLRELLIAHEGPDAFFEQEGGMWAHVGPPSFLGRRFGAYVVESEIGRGGMGTVYRASRADEVFYKTVAIKLIAGGAALSESALDAFRRERQILAQLEHPNIARLLDAGSTEDGLLYLIMEYVNGLPLDEYIERNSVPLEGVLGLFLDVLKAVSFAHRNLVVHRDLKPSNVMVASDGQVKLLDFGIAKVLSPGKAITATVALRLTPEFASPEHIRGQGVSTVSDVYSLGVILFHLLTRGAKPYRATSQAVPDLLRAVLESETPKPSTLAPKVWSKRLNGDLDNIVLKAMDKDAARRYASVDQFAEDIGRYLTGRTVHARPVTFRYRTAKFLRRNQWGAAAVLVIVLAAGSSVWTTFRQTEIAHAERARAEAERKAAVEARLRAEEQRRIALGAQTNEAAQRQLAELRSREALTERERAESRYQNVRSLATAILTDVNDALRELPGSGPARQKALLAALRHLEDLKQKSGGDVALMEDLARAYEQTGELMQTAYPDPRESAVAAMETLEKARVLRNQILTGSPRDEGAQLRLARCLRLLGNAAFSAGQGPRARELYFESLRRSQGLGGEGRMLAGLAAANLCTALQESGEAREALAHCRSAVGILAAANNEQLAATRLRYASALRASGNREGAWQEYSRALDAIDPDEKYANRAAVEAVRVLEGVADNTALQAKAKRVWATTLAKSGARDEALERFEESLKLLGQEAPPMRQVLDYADQAERLAEARAWQKKGQAKKAIEILSKAIEQMPKNPSDPANLLRGEFQASLKAAELAFAQSSR